MMLYNNKTVILEHYWYCITLYIYILQLFAETTQFLVNELTILLTGYGNDINKSEMFLHITCLANLS